MVELPVKMYVGALVKKARAAARPLANLSQAVKDRVFAAMADRLLDERDAILEANSKDIEAAGKIPEGESNKDRVKEAVERVRVTAEAVEAMAETLRAVAALPDPVGQITGLWTRPNGLQVSRMRAPIGVIAIVSDQGPRIGVETMALCLKAGNVTVLREGSEWANTNLAIYPALREAGERAGLPAGALSVVERTERDGALEVVRLPKQVDAVIPRGSAALRRAIVEQSKVPVLGHEMGVSHLYVDADADLPMAQNLLINSKVQAPGAFNSVDTLLVHQTIARMLVPGLVRRLLDEFKIEVKACPKTVALTGAQKMTGYQSATEATEEDWSRQFLGKVLAVKVVKDLDEALDHLATYGPSHTDVIVTRSYEAAMRFAREVDAAAVLVNASSRFHEGPEFGIGGQVGTGTGRLHARGALGLDALTCERFLVLGAGQLREPHPVPTPYEDAIMLKRGMG